MSSLIKSVVIHVYLFSLNLSISLFNKLGLIDNKLLLEFSIAQVFVGVLSSIYFFRFPAKKNEVSLDYFVLAALIMLFIIYKNRNNDVAWSSIIVLSFLLFLKDILRLSSDCRISKTQTYFCVIPLLILLIFTAPNFIIFLLLPIFLISLKQRIPKIYFTAKVNILNFKYLFEDLPIFLFTYLITVESFRYLNSNSYSNFRFIISLTSLSALFQYALFQIYQDGESLKKTLSPFLNLVIFGAGILLFFLFPKLEVISTYTIVVSGIYYFYLKSIFKIKYLFFLNFLPVLFFYGLLMAKIINYNSLLLIILTAGAVPILFYFVEIYKNECLLFREK